MSQVSDTVMTVTEMRALLRDDEGRVLAARRDLEEAQRVYASLSNRWHYSSDEGHAIGMRDALPALERAERDARRKADAAERNTRRVRAQVQSLANALDPEVRIRATPLLPMVEHEATHLRLPELAERVKAAIVREDRESQFGYAQAVPERLEMDTHLVSGRDKAAVSELRGMLSAIRLDLRDPSFDPVLKTTDQSLLRTEQLRSLATTRQRDLESKALVGRDGRPRVVWPGR